MRGFLPNVPLGSVATYGAPSQHGGFTLHTSSPQHIRTQYTNGNGRQRQRSGPDFIFQPQMVSMGSLVGKQFIQMLGASVQQGEDYGSGGRERWGKSYLAFDFKKELILIKSSMELDSEKLPPALRPVDAELFFDDVAAQGISINHRPAFPQAVYGTSRRGLYQVTVTISVRRPPKFFVVFEESEVYRDSRARSRLDRRRATAMDFAISGVSERDAGPIPAIPEGPCAYPTFWNTYRWTLVLNQNELYKLEACASRFEALTNLEPEMELMSPHNQKRMEVRVLDPQSYHKLYSVPDMSSIRFSARTLIEGLIAHGILKPGDLEDLLRALEANAVVPAFQNRILESLYSEERIRNIQALIRGKARYLRHQDAPNLAHLVMIRTVLVTPTRLVISPPQQEPSNSVTRRYEDKLDCVLRVIFADEEDKLFVLDNTKFVDNARPDVGVMARVRRALQHGLLLGGRRFLPVASSASQQKDHAIWFIDTGSIDGLELRRWMGTVDETIVAKHAARMGLPFSSSRIVDINIQLGPELPDVKRNDYCFTDGVGVAGKEVMREAAKALGSTTGLNSTPSAIQFRLGGAKGVLACWPNLAQDHEVRLRKSLIKFNSNLVDLNVVRLAKYQVAFLNRQFIMIMCANGVPEQLIIGIFHDAVNDIKGLKQRVKAGTLTREDHRLINSCSEFPLGQLIRAGFNTDPLVLDIAEIVEVKTLQDLKWKARVKIEGGVFLIGIADETGLLKEGELFCQYQESDQTVPVIVQSEVLICRAPALHPGDVRRAFAVDIPELRHLKNVIVFNTKGQRDLPNMLGGGDLDGDDYTLIWDQRFVQTLKVYEPMDYTPKEPVRVEKVTQEHLNENFVQYILNDVLGQVDNLHLALSDINGPFDLDCLGLSQIHSTAVDFAKTGIAAELDSNLKPWAWPDFMDRNGNKRRVYESQKVLGTIFRVVHPEPHFRPCDIKSMGYPTDPRIVRYPIYERLLEQIKPLKAAFENGMQYDMRRYRVFEPEIPSGIAIPNKRRKRARDQNLNEPLRDSYDSHVRKVRVNAAQMIEGVVFSTSLSPMQVIARHAYALTFEKDQVEQWEAQLQRETRYARGFEYVEDDDGDEVRQALGHRPMTSFAWCFWEELVQIANLSRE